MGEGALNAPVCAELGMDVAGSLAVLDGRKSKFLTELTLGLFSVRGHQVLVCDDRKSKIY
jgi:hypothetical protein